MSWDACADDEEKRSKEKSWKSCVVEYFTLLLLHVAEGKGVAYIQLMTKNSN